ncbi:hypothetical protein D9M70_356780 [compost metagenome]
MAEHHALGEAGGAAGVEDAEQRIAATAGVFHGLAAFDQRLVAEHAFGSFAVAGMDHRADGLRIGGDARAELLEGVIDDQDGGIRIVQGIDDLRGAPADVHRVEHRIGPGHGLVVLDVALGIEGKHGHAVAAGHAQLLQRSGQAGDALAELGVGHAAAVDAYGGGIRAPLQVAVQALGDVHRKSCPLLFLLQLEGTGHFTEADHARNDPLQPPPDVEWQAAGTHGAVTGHSIPVVSVQDLDPQPPAASGTRAVAESREGTRISGCRRCAVRSG